MNDSVQFLLPIFLSVSAATLTFALLYSYFRALFHKKFSGRG